VTEKFRVANVSSERCRYSFHRNGRARRRDEVQPAPDVVTQLVGAKR
jgi:hypothetical protein